MAFLLNAKKDLVMNVRGVVLCLRTSILVHFYVGIHSTLKGRISMRTDREEARGYERRRLATAMALLSGWGIPVPIEMSLARHIFWRQFRSEIAQDPTIMSWAVFDRARRYVK
jgi:hypothetical protein